MPYAIGPQLTRPERPVTAFTGDGSLSMGMGQPAPLARHGVGRRGRGAAQRLPGRVNRSTVPGG
ncbi:thiamine pyrophosphate-dependent enzyme [Streptomyces sennicomposti]